MSKKLSVFEVFNAKKFLDDKTLLALAQDTLKDSDGNQTGFTMTVVVYDDRTDYGDDTVTNAGDSYKVKIPNIKMNQLELPAMVQLVEPTGKVWGEFRNNLSLSAQNIVELKENK